MTQDEIKELIRECRNPVGYIGNWGRVQWADNVYPQLGDDLYAGVDLEAFAKLVAAKERENYDNLFEKIKNWCEAYPIEVFPEPDFCKAHEVLKANGMTLDAISASNMKHVITQVQKMIDAAIQARGEA